MNTNPLSFYDDFRTTGQSDAIRLGWRSHDQQQANFVGVLSLIEKRLSLKGLSVHDAGCGHGDVIPHLQSREIGSYVGTDAMNIPITIARKRHESHDFRRMDLLVETVPKADVTLCIGSLAFYPTQPATRLISRLWHATDRALAFSMWWELTPEFLLWRDANKTKAFLVALAQREARAFEVIEPAVVGGEAYVVLHR